MESDSVANDDLRRVTMRVTFSLDNRGRIVGAVGSPTGDVDIVDLYHVLEYLSGKIRCNSESVDLGIRAKFIEDDKEVF